MPWAILAIVTAVDGSILVLLQLYIAVFHRHSSVGSWELVEGLAVCVGAICMLFKVVPLPLPHP